MADYMVRLWVTGMPAQDAGEWGKFPDTDVWNPLSRTAEEVAKRHQPWMGLESAVDGGAALDAGLKKYVQILKNSTLNADTNNPYWIKIGGYHYVITPALDPMTKKPITATVDVMSPNGLAKLPVIVCITGLAGLIS